MLSQTCRAIRAIELLIMAAVVALPGEEFFSESYLDAFYKAHVASSRSRGPVTLDDDIAAIEAEIRKVQHYRSKFRNYRFNQQQQQQQHSQLNSCGNSECSDEDEVEDASPTSVFKVYNSSSSKREGDGSPFSVHKSPDIFSWAAAQQVQHDHNYCCEVAPKEPQCTVIDHGTTNIHTIQWQELSTAKRAQTVQKLSCILQQKPSGRQSPTFSSLDWLSNSLVNWIKKTGSLGTSSHSHRDKPHPLPTSPSPYRPCTKSPHATKKNLRNKLVQSVAVSSQKHNTRHKRKQAPYNCKLTKKLNIEVTRVRNISSCEREDSVVID